MHIGLLGSSEEVRNVENIELGNVKGTSNDEVYGKRLIRQGTTMGIEGPKHIPIRHNKKGGSSKSSYGPTKLEEGEIWG